MTAARALTPADAAHYRRLRLRALAEHPEAFGASYEDEQGLGDEEVAAQMRAAQPHTLYAGAFAGPELVGILLLTRYLREKVRHKAMLGGMYVAAELHGRGVGRALLGFVLEQARALDGLEDLTLAVTVGNEAARRLYEGAGFVAYGVEPRYIRVGTTYHDIVWMHLRLHSQR